MSTRLNEINGHINDMSHAFVLLKDAVEKCKHRLDRRDYKFVCSIKCYDHLVEGIITKESADYPRNELCNVHIESLLPLLHLLEDFLTKVSKDKASDSVTANLAITWGLLSLVLKLYKDSRQELKPTTDAIKQFARTLDILELYGSPSHDHHEQYLLDEILSYLVNFLLLVAIQARMSGYGKSGDRFSKISHLLSKQRLLQSTKEIDSTLSNMKRAKEDFISFANGKLLHQKQLVHPMMDESPPRQPNENGQQTLYGTLDVDSYDIRILNIDAGSGDDPTQCILELVSLINPGVYTALSYCWGTWTLTTEIIVNDQIIPVRSNLATVLKLLRENKLLRVWIDALCINQGDRLGRSLQVRNIMKIYSAAASVFVWTGDADFEEVVLVKYQLESLSREISRAKLGSKFRLSVSSDQRGIAQGSPPTSDAEQNTEKRQQFIVLQRFFDRPYWKRVWIIQEVAVSTKFSRTLEKWSDNNAVAAHVYALPLLDFRHRHRVTEEPITLFEALRWSHQALSTDPRDKIFALLGLTSDGDKIVPLPNYKQTAEEIWREMTRRMISVEKRLDFLFVKRSDKIDASGQPSWVPDWPIFWKHPRTLLDQHYADREFDLKIENLPLMDPAQLILQGCNMEEIWSLSSGINTEIPTEIACYFEDPIDPKNIHYQAWCDSFEKLRPSDVQYSIYRSLCLELFADDWKVHEDAADVGPHSSRTSQSIYEIIADFFEDLPMDPAMKEDPKHVFHTWLQANQVLRIGKRTLRDWFKPAESQLMSEQALELDQRVLQIEDTPNDRSPETQPNDVANTIPPSSDHFILLETMTKKIESSLRLMVTSGGRIGMAHPAAQIGDLICNFEAHHRLVILRKDVSDKSPTGRHRIVGTATIGSRRSEEEEYLATISDVLLEHVVLI